MTFTTELRDYVSRSLVPKLAIGVQQEAAWLGAARTRLERAVGRTPAIELYFAFDDPYSTLALVALAPILRRRRVDLVLYPLMDRGIAGDPDLPLRRAYAIQDSRRLARRMGLVLGRSEPIAPDAVRFLAEWTEAVRGFAGMEAFAVAASKKLWLGDNATIDRDDYARLYEMTALRRVPESTGVLGKRLEANAKRLRRKGHYDTPAAWVAGEWFLAHERLSQLQTRLDALGWGK